MNVNTQPADLRPITGQEVFWGQVKPTPEALALINSSPTLIRQIHETDARIGAGQNLPMAVSSNTQLPYYGESGDPKIVFPSDYGSESPPDFVGKLSHELAHLIFAPRDKKFQATYSPNPRDPSAYTAGAMYAQFAQSEAQLNHWQAGREIQQATATPEHPGTDITENLVPGFREYLDENSALNLAAGKTQAQNESQLIAGGMGLLSAESGGGGDPNAGDYATYGNKSGAAPLEPGVPASISFEDDGNYGIKSSHITWPSGDTTTQSFADGKLQVSQTVDPSGKPLSTAQYTYQPGGGYKVDVTNGAGQPTQQNAFNADGSGSERGFRPDGSWQDTQFDRNNNTTLITDHGANGHERQKDYFDAQQQRETNRVVTMSDGSHTVYSLDANGNVGLRMDYDSSGRPLFSAVFDPQTGRTSLVTRYNADGSRLVSTVGDNGQGSNVFVDKDGKRGSAEPTNFSPEEHKAFEQLSRDASGFAPPQPAAQENALGGQRNYFDPATYRRTNQVITTQDGGHIVNSFDDKNQIGSSIEYGANGKRTHATYYNNGSLDTTVQFQDDGGRTSTTYGGNGAFTNKTFDAQNNLVQSVVTSKTDNGVVRQETYGPNNDLRQTVVSTMQDGGVKEETFDPQGKLTGMVVRTMGPDGSSTQRFDGQGKPIETTQSDDAGTVHDRFLDPQTGAQTNQVVTNKDGTRTVYSFNDQGQVGSKNTYDASGRPTSSTSFDPHEGPGTLTSVNYNGDGSRNVQKATAEGITSYVVQSDGQQSDRQTVPQNQSNLDAFKAWQANSGMAGTSASAGQTAGRASMDGERASAPDLGRPEPSQQLAPRGVNGSVPQAGQTQAQAPVAQHGQTQAPATASAPTQPQAGQAVQSNPDQPQTGNSNVMSGVPGAAPTLAPPSALPSAANPQQNQEQPQDGGTDAAQGQPSTAEAAPPAESTGQKPEASV